MELAYNQDYVDNLNAALFEDEHACHVKELLEKHPLGMHALMRSDIDSMADALSMLPRATHFQVKDVQKRHGEYRFPAIGQGDPDDRQTLVVLADRQIPCSLAIPRRMYRQADTFPVRSADKVSLDLITELLADSRKSIESVVGYSL